MEALGEILQFLDVNARLDLKVIALQHVLSITGTAKGRDLLQGHSKVLQQLVILIQDKTTAVAKDAALALVNISGDEDGAKELLHVSEASKAASKKDQTEHLVHVCVRFIMDKNSVLADPCCMILSNMTRPSSLVNRMVTLFENSGFSWDSIVAAFTATQYNNVGANLHYLGPVFSNLSQSPDVRRFLMDIELRPIQRLLPFTEYPDSIVRRGGIVGTLKNCCFDTDNHSWLLSPEIDILPYLLLPLAGPEEFDEEDSNKLPLDLQYLPETKKRESDPDIKIMLLEAIGLLCTTKQGRQFIRDKNAYIILREFHKAEKDRAVLLACENVVDILIRTEDEIGLDNIKDVDVPTKYVEKFKKMDEDFVNGE
ncbi:protein HGH1 homolog isoform X2 [Venturia canescens]|uniref:protein HGH1 homolog isoform X2 n=1 Tax=Venturia canescens TaxID=32260 RepID=UPI001C9C733B|nr:protein HGH1 homolog isoform X2 [Venturia canescens]